MKRRAISFITVFAMCLSLCPMRALAADWELDAGLCSHHRVHTEECGYVPPTPGRDCSHEHDESCFVTEILCIHHHTEDCYPGPEPDSDVDSELEPSLCTHECGEASGCAVLTPDCPHVHDEACGFVPEDAGAPCTFVCRLCPIEDLMNELPRSITPDNKNQVEDQLTAILALYTELTAGEQDQLDLSRCFDLQAQLDAANTPALLDVDDVDRRLDLAGDWTNERLNTVTDSMLVNTHGYSYTATKTGAFQVQRTGGLYIMGGGTISAQKGSGVEVLAGGHLYISDSSLTVTGSTYGLDIASGATVELSSGTYTGKTAAIRTSDNNFGALLKPGCAYFDVGGNPIPLTDVAEAKTVVVKTCTDHQSSYTHNGGASTHAWTCAACGTSVASEPCTFLFDENAAAECVCGNTITIDVDENSLSDLVYDGNDKTANVSLTVTLGDGTTLTEDTNYEVSHSTRADVGEITVTVTGITYIGTFTKTYQVTQAQPGIRWDSFTCSVDYSGSPVKESDLPQVVITAHDDLSQSVRYSYKGAADSDFIDGLPTNAGTYEIKASLLEQHNYTAAETNPCLQLTINQIPAVIDEPKAEQLVYNGVLQNLVSGGTVHNGVVIEFAQSQGGRYSTDIPAAINAGGYEVWYRVAGTENYIGVPETKIENVQIQRKPITPTVELSSYTYLYDGGDKEPAVTVKDGETELPKSEYKVEYVNNRNVSTAGNPAKVVVTDAPLGNYEIERPGVEAAFEITILTQAALSITNKPNTVIYGGKFTLGTSGGSGNGNVTWEITSGKDVAEVDRDSGQVTITGHGQATIRATKSGAYNGVTNYEDAVAVWTFTADRKPVVATVTAEDRIYNGRREAEVHAVVEQGVLAGDQITIEGLTGEFSDEKAGTNKTVTVTIGTPQISGTNWVHYDITYSSAPVTANIAKAPTSIKTIPAAQSLTYNGGGQALVGAGEADIAAIPVEYALSESGPYSTDIPEAADAGKYEVWYRVQETENYAGTEPQKVAVEIEKAEAVIAAPIGKTGLRYNGTAQNLIIAGSSAHGTVVYSLDKIGEYSAKIPTGTNVQPYEIWYKVLGDSNHKDSDPLSVGASIVKNRVTQPTIQVSPASSAYNGQKQVPAVTVIDDDGYEIASSEYTVGYSGDMTNVGKYTLTITSAGSNYEFDAANNQNTAEFEILRADQKALAIVGVREHVYYGDKILLDTTGGDGDIAWSVSDQNVAQIGSDGLLTVTGVGPVRIKATSSNPNYTEKTAVWSIYVEKKQAEAVLTAANITYSGANPSTTAVTGTLRSSDLVAGDSVTITNMTGTFDDPDVGTNKKVTVTAANPKVEGTNADKYNIAYPTTTTATIFKAKIESSAIKPPLPETKLTYTGSPQKLVAGGSVAGGTLEYSLDNAAYSPSIPTGVNAGAYDIWYRVKGDSNHNDTAGEKLGTQAVIAQQKVASPIIELNPSSAVYDGSVKKPVVEVKDNEGRTIPKSEYTVTYDPGTDWKEAGSYQVTITNKANGNYDITQASKPFQILPAGQYTLSIVRQPDTVRYGDTFTLSTLGGSGTGAVQWSINDGSKGIASISQSGTVTILKPGGPVKVTAQKSGGNQYEDITAEWTFFAEKRPVTPVVTAANKNYDGTTDASLSVAWKNGDLVGNDEDGIEIIVKGEFESRDVGTNKKVSIQLVSISGNEDKYDFTCPDSTTASIYRVTAEVDPKPEPVSGLTYNRSPQALITGGSTVKNIGVVKYSLSEKGEYSTTIPAVVNAGAYEVWYMVEDNVNYMGVTPRRVLADIEKADPSIDPTTLTASPIVSGQPLNQSTLTGSVDSVSGSFSWVNGDVIPVDGTSYKAIFTPDDAENYNTVTVDVPVTVTDSSAGGDAGSGTDNTGSGSDSSAGGTGSGSDNSTGGTGSTDSNTNTNNGPAASAPMQTSVQNGTATTVLNAAAGDKLVREAAANQSTNVVIKPEIAGDVTKANVSIPTSTVSQLGSKTSADLTVSTPMADVTIPNAALDTLSSAGGTVNVVTEQVENAVALTLTAGGRNVESVPGGLTLTVPVEDAAPGTVAVLVHDNGTRETLRKAVAEDGRINVQLDGPATVEIVDNSKEFTDVSADNWAADAVAFASAHELFHGTSETTFSPDEPMSRAMLATVLYNLEGRPAQSSTSGFNDVSSDAWYAQGVSWAAENGITNGYSDDQFGPNDHVTREQFAVMLWKYAGSPASNGGALSFTDADQVSGYAAEAVRWAAAKGILNGHDNGRLDPGGATTRAQAAQMLKNFMENT